jgi:serine/threonine protein kinase
MHCMPHHLGHLTTCPSALLLPPGEVLTSRAGTPVYLSPELVRQHYGLATDLWSTGILAYQLLTGRLPFSDPDGSDASESYISRQVGHGGTAGAAGCHLPAACCCAARTV